MKTIPNNALQFISAQALQFKKADKESGQPRTFSGVAYSGDILQHRYWDQVAFDLSTLKPPQKLPMLIGHDRDQNAGFSESVTTKGKVEVSGILLDNVFGQRIANDADQGFPWQMSVHIQPGSIEEVKAGSKATVNGREMTGPGVIFKNATFREISFTPTGVDPNTSTTVFSTSYFDDDTHQQGATMPTEKEIQLQAALDAANEKITTFTVAQDEMKASLATLTDEKKARDMADKQATESARFEAVKKMYAAQGKEEPKQEDKQVAVLMTMTAEQFAVFSDLNVRPAVDETLFTETNLPDAGNAMNQPAKNPIVAAFAAEYGDAS